MLMTMMSTILTTLMLMLVGLMSVLTTGPDLGSGDIGFIAWPLPTGLYQIEATDGKSVLSAVVSRDHGFITCEMSNAESAVAMIMADTDFTVIHVGEDQVRDMWMRCVTAGQIKQQVQGHKKLTRALDAVAYPDAPFKPENNTGFPEGQGSHLAIVPGTRWCGKGNIAANYSDLGPYNETDACCREHDQCPFFIPALTDKYNYFNTKPWTLSYCDCDTAIFNCLKQVNNSHADAVGHMFFGLLGVQCFKFDEGEYCYEYHWTHLWCNQYTNGSRAVLQEFPLHWEDEHTDTIG